MSTSAFAPTFGLANPFAPHVAPSFEEEIALPGEDASYALIASGPPVAADEVESDVDAVEIRVRWGSQLLSVSHVGAGKSFFVGDGSEVVLSEQTLGASRLPLVAFRGAQAVVQVPPRATGVVARAGGGRSSLAELARAGALPTSSTIAGGFELTLEAGMSVVLELTSEGTEPVIFDITTVRGGKKVPFSLLGALLTGATGFVGISLLGHAAIVASMAMFMPAIAADDAEGLDRDQILMMQKLLSASAEREAEPPKETAGSEDEASGGGSTGAPHKGESGAAGTPKAVTTNGHMGFKGADARSAVSRREELQAAAEFGMIGMVASAAYRDPNAPSSPWSNETYQGSDDKSAMGKLFGASIDDAAGFGLGLWGTGEGGGGTADVVGLDHINTVGGGGGGPGKWGVGKGDKDGWGNGHGPGHGGHTAKALSIRPNGEVTSNGRLPADVIQRIVRQNFGRFRLCYEAGLRQNPSLTGRISTKFVIGRDGQVMQSQDSGSDMPDQQVVSCVVRSFSALSFPAPEGGIATVTYPIVLTPGE